MDLGTFSVSLAVKDLAASRAFYAALGFTPAGGDGQRFQIMRNGATTIGLFQGMFEQNILTFNPGWDAQANPLPAFTDVRELQRRLGEQGIGLVTQADESATGPASLLITGLGSDSRYSRTARARNSSGHFFAATTDDSLQLHQSMIESLRATGGTS